MIKIAICDDDEKDRVKLQRFLENYISKSERECSLHIFESGVQFLISGFIPNILFLDIIMDDKDGIEVAAELERISANTRIIYITNSSQKMAVALNHIHSFGYLIKPIVEDDVFCMMEDAIWFMERKLGVDLNEEIVTFLSVENTSVSLRVMDIYYFEYKKRIVKIVTRDNTYFCKEKINEIARRMEEYGFAMSHQSFVVNLYYIEKIAGLIIYMKNGDQVCLAQKRASSFRKQLMLTARNSINRGGRKNKLTQ